MTYGFLFVEENLEQFPFVLLNKEDTHKRFMQRVVYHGIHQESLVFSRYTHKPLYQVIENTVGRTRNATYTVNFKFIEYGTTDLGSNIFKHKIPFH